MNATVILAAFVGSVATFFVIRSLVGESMRLSTRIGPYTVRARRELGTTQAVSTTTPVSSVWGPIFNSLTTTVAKVADAGETETLELRIRNAGMNTTVDEYRRRQLLTAVGGAAVGMAAAVVFGLSPLMALLVVTTCAFIGTTRQRALLNGRTEKRRRVMQSEAHIICQLLATYLRTKDTPMSALERLQRRTTGEIPGELAHAVGLIRRGRAANEVFDEIAATTAEPYAARLYRLYGATWNASGDPTALLSLAEVLRNGRREHLSRHMAKRRTLMALPLVMIIGPILILFIAAAIPSIVLGR